MVYRVESPESLIQALAWHAAIRTGAIDTSTGGRGEGAVPLVYIDKNPWGRHLDDLSVARNAEEAKAFAALLDLIRKDSVRLVYSSVSFGEGVPRDGSASAAGVALREVIGLRLIGSRLICHDERADTWITAGFLHKSWRIAGYDAIHAAAALLEGAWYFVTGDDRLRKRLGGLFNAWSLPLDAVSPVGVIARLERGARIED